MQIIITAQDGQITVEADGKDPYECKSAEECSEYVETLLAGAGMTEEPPEQAGDEEMDMEAAWNEEAAKRPGQPNLMA